MSTRRKVSVRFRRHDRKRCRHGALNHVLAIDGGKTAVSVFFGRDGRNVQQDADAVQICGYCGSWRWIIGVDPGPWQKPRRAP